jgi:hypothetical protein
MLTTIRQQKLCCMGDSQSIHNEVQTQWCFSSGVTIQCRPDTARDLLRSRTTLSDRGAEN